jgi:hypothetical protein
MASKLQAIIVFSLLFLSLQFFGQRPEDQLWHRGYLVLDTHDTIKGLLKYDFQNNFIEYQKGEEYRFLLPGKFTKAVLHSSVDSIRHEFEVYTIKTGHDYYRPYFFEIVDTVGKIKLAQTYFWTERANAFGQFGTFIINYEKITNLFYVNELGEAKYIKPKKKIILKLTQDKADLVKIYAKKEHLHYNSVYGVVKIIKYYNSLVL